jgi:hypothetical protein
MATKTKTASATALEKLIVTHTNLGLLCGTLARDSRLPWKTRKVFESYAWAILEQVKGLRTQDLSGVPDEFLEAATHEVTEALIAGENAKVSGDAAEAAIAAIETFQAIDAVDGILGNKAAST